MTRLLGLVVLLALTAAPASAQIDPSGKWRTLRTQHFAIHFKPELEHIARRAAVQAESAYTRLSQYLTRPRGTIDMVIADDVDYANGFASPFPGNRIGIYASPPVFESSLRYTDDPLNLVITHELVHIFHLDRSGGIWKVLQSVFGRMPLLFPSAFQPSWLVEGLAVHYESELTGFGRIAGSDHRMIARTAATAHRVPRIDQLSLANPVFPYGYGAYAYGSLFIDHLADKHGESALRRFVDSYSRQLVPLWLDRPARRAFGTSFTAAYREWVRTLTDSAPADRPPLPGWRDLTVDGAYAAFPRWVDDSTLIYVGTPGRETYAAWLLRRSPDGAATRERIARRNSRSPTTMLRDGSLLYSQQDFVSPHEIRSDLYVDSPRGDRRRLTRGARLAVPDARGDGLIAAVQTVPGGTRLALVSPDGQRIAPITRGGLDETWTEPRWSPDGRHIAAARWRRGGESSIVVVDTTGSIVATIISERAVNAAPSWSRDGGSIYFSSDRSGATELYRATFVSNGSAARVERLSGTASGIFEPQPSPDDREVAAVVFRLDGYHVGTAPLAGVQATAVADTVAAIAAAPITAFQGASTPYSPWRTLRPRYWMPFLEDALTENSLRIGAITSGEDAVGRHGYQGYLGVPTDNSGLIGALYYRNALLGQPILEFSGSQEWEDRGCIFQSDPGGPVCVGQLNRRIRDADLAATFQRPRFRTFSYASIGVGVEARDYATDPVPLIGQIDPAFSRVHVYPRATVSAGWANTQTPPMAISPEDGVSLATSGRVRWRTGGEQTATVSVIGTAGFFKSLDLPGFAHHVLALRTAFGAQDDRGTGYYEVGGTSGALLEVLAGYALGEGRRTFFVRGFESASMIGNRAAQGSLEYRAPLRLPGRGLGTLPLFFDRTSITLFGDAGTAWCTGTAPSRPLPNFTLCSEQEFNAGLFDTTPRWIGSAGGELNLSAAIFGWDEPFRYRLGYAAQVYGRENALGTQKRGTLYFTVGTSF